MKTLTEYKNALLQDPIESSTYLNCALEEYAIDHDKQLLLNAIRDIIKAQGGISKIARATHINRQHVYKMLSAEGNPTLDKFGILLSALGMKLVVQHQHNNNLKHLI